MLARLEGTIISQHESHVELHAPPFTFLIGTPEPGRFPVGQQSCLHVELLLRDEKPVLYGFESAAHKQAFLELLKIPSLGPKIAFEILKRPLADFLLACQKQDKAYLSQIPGIGPKMAARIFAEIRLERFPMIPANSSEIPRFKQDAHAALLGLGFDAASIYKALSSCVSGTFDTLVKEALQKLGEQRV